MKGGRPMNNSSAWFACGAVITLFVALSLLRLGFVRDERRTFIDYQLRFPRNLPVEAVQRFLAGWSGSLPPAWKRWITGVPSLVVEVRAEPNLISHHLLVAQRWA